MSILLAIVGGILFPLLSAHYIVHPRRITDASWYGHFSEYTNLYLFPPGFALLASVCWAYVADSWGLDNIFTVLSVVAMFWVALTALGFIAMLGVPMPPFMTPKWVRERRKADREAKRQRRAERKAARDETPETTASGD
ncbi:hypothetical protein [Zhihengliuella salsuginis]|uniref:SdpI/YhfL protein family protein n=1 Tax=Zhihengliuella salsuginis TaxID=578222 RepID=A0ABQ3GII0_9MICC|nr:hypothetical protein [Zhihengliuella salsuginis]GHD06115.1 hypothetical protein GCM10008096_15700 [Zhihengliuella salsuginis]